MAQNDKKFFLCHSTFEEWYTTWLWFLVHMSEMIISPAIFFIFQNFDIFGFSRNKMAKHDINFNVSRSISQELLIISFRFLVHRCKISPGFLLYLKKKCNIVNIKIILFLLALYNRFFNSCFFKFINKCQKEILMCAPPCSHVCDFY